jgi:uncharacterized protein YjbI with pentapeptide repeats
VNLDHADLRDADMTGCQFPELHNVRLDGACLRHTYIQHAVDCSFKKADLAEVHVNPAVFQGCDFTGASLEEIFGGYTKASSVIFRSANLRRAIEGKSDFRQADFTGADLSEGSWQKCDFSGATFARATLITSDLTDARFVNADMTKADLRDAILVGVDFTGAKITGADFTGANIAGAVLGNLDVTRAKGLVPGQASQGGSIGPTIRELESIAGKSRRLETGVHVDFQKKEIFLGIVSHQNSKWIATEVRDGNSGYHGSGKSLSSAMIDVTRRFTTGTLRLDSIVIKSSKCPLKHRELHAKAVAAWCEAMGVEAPTIDSLMADTSAKKKAKGQRGDELIELLRTGPKGVKAWNQAAAEVSKVHRFRRVDLSGLDLHGVKFMGLDLEGANFANARLSEADFQRDWSQHDIRKSSCNHADFHGADLRQADLRGSSFHSANFEGADLRKANLRASVFTNANFKNARLRDAHLHFAKLRGADFTSADLTDTVLECAEYDEKTILPKGFTPPEDMIWKGATVSKALLKTVAAAANPLDFDAFFGRLQTRIDADRNQQGAQDAQG